MKFSKSLGFQVLGTVLLAAGTALPARADYESTVLSQDPLGYWRLNETTVPVPAAPAANLGSLGTTAAGTYNNYPTRGLPGPFAGSLSLQFDGVSQTVSAPYAAELNPATFTIEAWLNPAAAKPVGNLRCLAASMHSVSPRSGWLIYQSGGTNDTAAPGFELRLYAENASATSLRLLVTNNVTPGTWYHLVYTFDGTTVRGYLNGVLANQGDPTGFVPNPDAVFSVGARSDNGFPWAGQSAEVAYYGAVLTGDQVKAHYDAASTNAAGYASQISAHTPLVYYRFREPADPVAANLGNSGTASDALYIYNAAPGVPGPQPPALQGFDAANKAVSFDGVGGGFVRISPFNLDANTVTITTWINAKGAQAKATGLVFSRDGDTVAGLNIDAVYGGLGLGYTWNNDAATYNWSPSSDGGLPSLPDSKWAFAALVVSPDQAVVYLGDPSNVAGFMGATNLIPHTVVSFNGATLLGADLGFTTPRFLNGALDEVAFFNRSLTAGEIFTQFATAVGGIAPKIFTDPQSPIDPVYAGDALTLTVDAGGTPNLSYQWRKGPVAISGATNNAYIIPSLVTGDGGSYDVVVTNPYGSATNNQAVAITVNPITAPTITQDIQGRTIYAGGTLKLTVTASGGALNYLWQKDGSPLVGATNATYQVASVTAADGGAYKVVVSNPVSTATSATASIVVVNPAAGSYAAVVVGDAPTSWWRLDDAASSPLMLDSMARNDGYYTNITGTPVTLGAPGVVAGNTAASSDGTDDYFGVVPYNAQLGSAAFTLECWAKVPDAATEYCPISFYEQTKKGCFMYSDSGAGSWRMAIGAGSDPYTFYYLGDVTGATIVPDKWMHLVMTCDSSSSVHWYVNGQQSGGYGNFPRNGGSPLLIGGVGPAINYKFKGTVDEIAFYTNALSQAQVQAHYVAAIYPNGSAPVFTLQPASQAVVISNAVSFTTLAEGTLGITYQWLKDGNVLANQTNTTLSLGKVSFADVGNYQVRAANSVGTNLSTVATLAVSPVPSFANATNGLVLHLRFEGDYTDSSGRKNDGTAVNAPTFVPGKIGAQALHFNTDKGSSTYNYVTLGTPADLKFSSNVNFSVSYWVRLPAGSTNGDLPFLCTSTGSYGGQGMTFAPSYKAGGWSWSLNGKAQIYGPDGSINDGKWHNLVHTFDRAGDGLTYLDGVEVDSEALASVGELDNSNPVTIGQDPSGTYAESGSADLDDLGIWRRALTPTEASAIYITGVNGTSFDTYGPVTINLTQTSDNLIMSWQAGTLVESDSLTGKWTPVAGAVAPNYSVKPGTGNKFYRVQL